MNLSRNKLIALLAGCQTVALNAHLTNLNIQGKQGALIMNNSFGQ